MEARSTSARAGRTRGCRARERRAWRARVASSSPCRGMRRRGWAVSEMDGINKGPSRGGFALRPPKKLLRARIVSSDSGMFANPPRDQRSNRVRLIPRCLLCFPRESSLVRIKPKVFSVRALTIISSFGTGLAEKCGKKMMSGCGHALARTAVPFPYICRRRPRCCPKEKAHGPCMQLFQPNGQ